MQQKGFGERLRRARNSALLKQSELARMIKVSRSTVNKWENEPDIDPGARALRRAAKVLNTTEEYLLNGGGRADLDVRLSRQIAKLEAYLRSLKPRDLKKATEILDLNNLRVRSILESDMAPLEKGKAMGEIPEVLKEAMERLGRDRAPSRPTLKTITGEFTETLIEGLEVLHGVRSTSSSTRSEVLAIFRKYGVEPDPDIPKRLFDEQ